LHFRKMYAIISGMLPGRRLQTSFLLAFLLEGTKGDDAFMGIVFAILRQAAVETYAAVAADLPLVIAAVQAALQLLGHLAGHIKK